MFCPFLMGSTSVCGCYTTVYDGSPSLLCKGKSVAGPKEAFKVTGQWYEIPSVALFLLPSWT
jgi:hypothetical protein